MQTSVPKHFNPDPFPYHLELELDIVNLTNLGHGIGKVDQWVVMVPFTIPGERVRARIYRNHKNYSEADLVEVLQPSPDRKAPLCDYFGNCGGCQYQHLSYSKQLETKRQHVKEVLERIAKMELEVATPIHSEREYHYRSKITPHYQRPRKGVIGPVGFLSSTNRNRIVDIHSCCIATDAVNQKYGESRGEMAAKSGSHVSKKGATLLFREVMEGVVTDHRAVVTERVGDKVFQFLAGDFFQNNPFVLPHMVDYVIREASATGLPCMIDAYCGSGLFSICGANQFERCIGIEINESAIRWARKNVRINGIQNCHFQVGEAASIFESVAEEPSHCVLIIDPPRKGCGAAFLEQVALFRPARLVYVSCDPSTQARDLVSLCQNGYKVERVQPVDLFPQTRHIENVITLSLQ